MRFSKLNQNKAIDQITKSRGHDKYLFHGHYFIDIALRMQSNA